MIIDGVRAKGLEFVPLPSLIPDPPESGSKNIIYYSRTKTGTLHDHTKSKKIPPKSSEEILTRAIVTEVGRW
jgi:hypothetical protein